MTAYAGKDSGDRECLFAVGESANWCNHCGNQCREFFLKTGSISTPRTIYPILEHFTQRILQPIIEIAAHQYSLLLYLQ